MTPFVPGDRVLLVKPFRCEGDSPKVDAQIDAELRGVFKGRPITGEVLEINDFILVDFDLKGREYDFALFVDADCLALEGPSDEEIKAVFGIEEI